MGNLLKIPEAALIFSTLCAPPNHVAKQDTTQRSITSSTTRREKGFVSFDKHGDNIKIVFSHERVQDALISLVV